MVTKNKIVVESAKVFEKDILEANQPHQYSAMASWQDNFVDIDTGINATSGFTWKDYDYFRPSEALPRKVKSVAKMCDMAYKRTPIVRTAIDLMSDFACQGIRVVHQNSNIQDFFQSWWKICNGAQVSERFLNYLYRRANVVVIRQMARIRETDMEKLEKVIAVDDFIKLPLKRVNKNEIPLAYALPDFCCFDHEASDLAAFIGAESPLVMNIPEKLRKLVKNPKTPAEKEMVAKLAEDVKMAIIKGAKKIPLDSFIASSYHYKRDDWDEWATPMLGAILDDLIMVEKMKLADRSALDGAISNIRLWKLGSFETNPPIMPSVDLINKFSDIITNRPGGGTMDIVWNPAIEMIESKSEVYKFLGSEKYVQHMQSIFQGLGIPPTLTGSATAGGTTNNFISLKTLVERLEYGRGILKSFWERELEVIRQARGFRFSAEIHFERMSLSDEVAEKALLRDLYDRGIISAEALLSHFGEIPDLERVRVVKENKERNRGSRVKQASPWHNPEPEHEYKKIGLQAGVVTPSEIGLELEERKAGQTPALQLQLQLKKEQQAKKNTGVPGQGRPKNSKDKNKRKNRTVKPRTSATQIQVWAADIQDRIAKLASRDYLELIGKQNLRQLTTEQFNELETRKFATLASMEPFVEITDDAIINLFHNDSLKIDPEVYSLYESCMANIKTPTANNLRQLQVISYSKVRKVKNVEN